MSWTTLRIDAWTGEAPAVGPVSPRATAWALQGLATAVAQVPLPPPLRRRTCAIGAIPKSVGGSCCPRAMVYPMRSWRQGTDAPEPIRELLASRPGSPVLRYIPDPRYSHTHLHDPGAGKDPMIGLPSVGLNPGAIPRYLLIYASPDEIPCALFSTSSTAPTTPAD